MDTQPYSNACYQQLWQDGLAQLSLLLNTQQVEQLQAYLSLLQKWNKTYNLTAIRQPQEAIVQHVFDSLSADCMLGDGRVLDVGTGGGTPGIPLAILRPHQSFTLLDSNQKKTTFVKVVKNELGLENVSVEHQRIESYQPQHRFDWVISRAFASMVDFTQGSQHCLMDGGHFLAMKGKSPESELSLIGKSLIMLKIHAVNVPYLNAQRHLVLLQKT